MTHLDGFKVEKVKEVFVNIVTNTQLKVVLSAISFIGEFVFKAHEQALLNLNPHEWIYTVRFEYSGRT